MTDTPNIPVQSSWIPTLDSIKAVTWTSIAKWLAALSVALLVYTGYANIGMMTEYLKPAPAPAVVDYGPDIAKLKSDLASLRGESKSVLDDLSERLAKLDLHLQVSEAALEELAKVGFDPVYGARPLKRAIQQRIENPLSRLILEGRFAPQSEIPVDVDPITAPGQFQFGRVVH